MYKLYVYYENSLDQLRSVGPKPTPGFEKKFSMIEAYVAKEEYKNVAASSLTKLQVVEKDKKFYIQVKVEKPEIQAICKFDQRMADDIVHDNNQIYTTSDNAYPVAVTKKSDPTEIYDFLTIHPLPQTFEFEEYSLYDQTHYCEYIIERKQ